MSVKLGKCEFPPNHGPNDFKSSGPVATKDGEFDGVCLVDLGCFNQEGVDSNKYYVAQVAQSTKNQKWYCYFEFARVGASNPQFQFIECASKEEAQEELAAQCHSKNDKRGIWKDIAGIKTLVAKPGKDVYKVQSLQSRSTGLPDARNITSNAGIDTSKVAAKTASPTIVKAKTVTNIDVQTAALLRDLRVGTVSFARSSLEGGTIPTAAAIDEARQVLEAVQKRLIVVGDNADDQVRDNEIKQLTYHLYSRIPKKKDQRIAAEKWILSKNNVLMWKQDLDAFEGAIYANAEVETPEQNPYGDLPITMEWLSPTSDLGKLIYSWMPAATANKHYGIGQVVVKNAWKVARAGDDKLFQNGLERCRVSGTVERPLFQPNRSDLSREELKNYIGSNTGLLFHGTRSVNVSGILRTMLRFPKDLGNSVVITGACFGSGAYFADDVKKSIGYTSCQASYWAGGSGAIQGRGAFMFIMDCALGKPFTAPRPHGYNVPPVGHNCVFGKGGYSQVQNNEWVIFNRDQINMRYLVEFGVR